jgi:hypothetical protein
MNTGSKLTTAILIARLLVNSDVMNGNFGRVRMWRGGLRYGLSVAANKHQRLRKQVQPATQDDKIKTYTTNRPAVVLVEVAL